MITQDVAAEMDGQRFLFEWKPAVFAGLLGGTAFVLSGGTAMAQEEGTTLASTVDPSEGGEIVVSARRRDEALTAVPASITALSSDYLEEQNIQSFTDYATKVPNLSFQYGQGGSLLWSGDRETTIRGVVGTGTTAYYINDTPIPASVSPQTLNLDRIEVLKGPQGTLFGAGSMGGTLRFITAKPLLGEDSGTIQLQGGSTRGGRFDFDGNAQANIALVPGKAGLNVALGYTRESGFIKRRFPDASGQLVTRDAQGRNENFSLSLAFRAELSESLEATISVLGQTSELHGFPAAYVPLPSYRPLSYTVDRDRDVQEYAKDRWGLGSLVLNYTGGGFSMVSSTSFFARRIRELEDDTEGTNQFFEQDLGIDLGGPAFYVQTSQRDRSFTQETRLSFDDGAILPRLSGIVGFFHQRERQHAVAPGIFVQEMADAGLTPPYLSDTAARTRDSNTAFFGELYYEPLPRLTVTLGLRQYWIRQNRDASIDTGFLYGPEGMAEYPALHSKESGLVPKAVLSYEIGDRGNIYASVSKGFRPGGSEGRLPDFCSEDLTELGLAVDDVGQYRSDTLWSYEVGAKSRLAGGRLNASAAAFRMDWSDIQQAAFLPICGFPFTANAGRARIEGGEVEIGGQPFAGIPLSVQFGLGYTDATLRDPGLLPQAPDSRLALVPKWNGMVSGIYETPISNNASLFVAADYSYTSSVEVADGLGGFHTRQPLNMVNGNFGIDFGRSEIMVYAKNLLDEHLNFGDQPSSGFERQELLDDGTYQRLPRAVVSRPRQIGVQFQLEF
jgi:outer membrane receptor protein involved in Fe transport